MTRKETYLYFLFLLVCLCMFVYFFSSSRTIKSLDSLFLMELLLFGHKGLGFMKMAMGEDQLLVSSSISPTTTTTTKNNTTRAAVPISQQMVERKARPQKELVLHCPRCNSTNTKFCYYNNYSLTQPRYFCKACRRYWTEGGSIRNVPVGGGSRKNKRRFNPPPSATSNIKNLPPHTPSSASLPTTTTSQPFNQVHDLNLAYTNHNHHFLNMESNNINNIGSCSSGLSGMELLMPMHMPIETMPPPEESSDGTGMLQHAAGLLQFDGNMQEGARRLLFPFGDLKQEQHRGHGGEQHMFWNGMMGAGAGAGSW